MIGILITYTIMIMLLAECSLVLIKLYHNEIISQKFDVTYIKFQAPISSVKSLNSLWNLLLWLRTNIRETWLAVCWPCRFGIALADEFRTNN